MNERPILFSTPMVRAILDGRKTQTRRVVKPCHMAMDHGEAADGTCIDAGYIPVWRLCPYGHPGDRLWVRETFRRWPDGIQYRADLPADDERDPSHFPRWKPSIHMPRDCSRILLEVTGVRAERLHAIGDKDARAEGAPCIDEASGREVLFPDADKAGSWTLGFRGIWQSINGEASWDANPWVWVVEFERVTP